MLEEANLINYTWDVLACLMTNGSEDMGPFSSRLDDETKIKRTGYSLLHRTELKKAGGPALLSGKPARHCLFHRKDLKKAGGIKRTGYIAFGV